MVSTPLLYIWWYRKARDGIKYLVEQDNITDAKTELDSLVTEHNQYLLDYSLSTEDETNTESEIVENRTLNHTKNHLDVVNENPSNTYQKNRTIRALDEEEL